MPIKKHDLGISTDLEVIDQFLSPSDQFLIDAGCGNMHLSKALASRGAHVLAIDPDPIQAAKNNKADTIANVGFAETGADAIPVEDQSVDGILFPYSLHHVPSELLEDVFAEVLRVLRPGGYAYIMEPVATGDLNEVMRLFHDESTVRDTAQQAVNTLGVPNFSKTDVIEYRQKVSYDSWDQFASKYAGKSFNTNYTEADIRQEHVREKFLEVGEHKQFQFESPMRVTYLQSPARTALS